MPRVLNKSIWPYQVFIERGDIKEFGKRVQWLKDNLYHGGYYEPKWYVNGDTYCFQDEKEYLHFLLVWQ
jgi:hypothetical protein